jgi:fructokinase
MGVKILAVGEVLWDLLPAGRQLGGAPGNFVCHAQALGAEARLVTQIGNDALGREVLERFLQKGIPTDTLTVDPHAPTGTVSVELGAGGQPTFTIHENAAWDCLSLTDASLAAAACCDAICFGSLGQRSEIARTAIRRLVGGTRANGMRIFDVNLRAPFYGRKVIEASLELANVLKLNDQELPILAEMFGLPRGIDQILAEMLRRYDLRLIALTRGSGGSLLVTPNGRSEHAGVSTDVRDTVGAGDAFTAAMTLGVLKRWNLDQISQRANEVAAYVCSQSGATPPLPASLRDAFAGG